MKVEHPALRWYGGKFRLGSWVASHFPPHVTYVEPYGGAAGVLLRKAPAPVEVYNDLDSEAANFFRVVRDHRAQFFRLVKHTPFSREEFERSYQPAEDPVEAARRFFVRSWQSFGGPTLQRRTGWKKQKAPWEASRANQLAEWLGAGRNLVAVANRFRKVQIEHRDALEVIQDYDSPETLFYIDPPYPTTTRNRRWMKAYSAEMGGQDHLHLLNLLRRVKGHVVLSTYPNPMYAEGLPGWEVRQRQSQTMNRTTSEELLYIKPA